MRFSFVDVRKSLRDFGYELLNFFLLSLCVFYVIYVVYTQYLRTFYAIMRAFLRDAYTHRFGSSRPLHGQITTELQNSCRITA